MIQIGVFRQATEEALLVKRRGEKIKCVLYHFTLLHCVKLTVNFRQRIQKRYMFEKLMAYAVTICR